MNINQDKRVKETAHPRPIKRHTSDAVDAGGHHHPGGVCNDALINDAERGAARDGRRPWRDGHGNTMDSNGVSYGPCAGVPLSAWAARRFGATQLWLYGLILFAIFSAVCALSPRFEVLLAARVLQGLAGGLLVPAGQTILGLVVGRERLGRVIGTIGVAIVIAPLLGTSLGAVLLEICGWRGLFWITVPFCLCACLAGWNLLPRPTIKTDRPLSLDWLGLALVFCSLPMLMEGMERAQPE